MSQKKFFVSMLTAMLLIQVCIVVSGFAEVNAEPDILVFHNMEQAEVLTLTADGESVSAQSVSAWRLLVDQRNYSHMLQVKPAAEGLRIQPSNTAEVGSYNLVLTTPKGEVAVQVFMPLSDQQSSLESLAQRMKISMEDLRKQMGLSQRLGREQITLNLLPIYYLGQRIQMDMPGGENRTAVWKVNGKITQEGADARHFVFVPEETGSLLVAYEEREKDAVVAAVAALTEVAREPVIPHEVKVGVRMSFQAPSGFAEHTWSIDNVQTGSGAVFEHTFSAPGQFLIAVKSNNPIEPGPYAFRETRYAVKVTEK